MDLLIITFVAVAVAVADRHPARRSTTAPAGKLGVGDHHPDPRPDADDADLRLPAARSCCSSASAPRRPSSARSIYALPPIIRIAGHGIRNVSATTHRGDRLARARPRWQRLTQGRSCRWPARPSSSGVNQTIMAALSMATIAAFVDGPGLGKPVLAGADPQRRRRRVRARHADRGHGGHARPHHDRRERGVREGRPRRASTSGCAGSCSAVAGVAVAGRGLPLAPALLGRRVPGDPAGDRRSPTRSTASSTGSPTPSTASTERDQGLRQRRPAQPAAVPARRVAVVRHRARDPARSPSSSAAAGPWSPTVICLAGIWFLDLWHDAMVTLTMVLVAHAAGDGPGGGLRGLDGAAAARSTSCCGRCSTPGRPSRRSST